MEGVVAPDRSRSAAAYILNCMIFKNLGCHDEDFTGCKVDCLDPNRGESVGTVALLDLVAAGGWGQVYLGQFKSGKEQGALTAVKVLTPGYSCTLQKVDQLLDMLYQQELASLQLLACCPHVVQLLGVGVLAGSGRQRRCLCLSWMPCGDARMLVDRSGRPLSEEAAGCILLPVLHALADAHELGIVHRDVKGSNILLGPNEVQLADWGISGPAGVMPCTLPSAAAPAAAASAHVGAAIDIGASGVTGAAGAAGHGLQPVEWQATETVTPILYHAVTQASDGGSQDNLHGAVAACSDEIGHGIDNDPSSTSTQQQLCPTTPAAAAAANHQPNKSISSSGSSKKPSLFKRLFKFKSRKGTKQAGKDAAAPDGGTQSFSSLSAAAAWDADLGPACSGTARSCSAPDCAPATAAAGPAAAASAGAVAGVSSDGADAAGAGAGTAGGVAGAADADGTSGGATQPAMYSFVEGAPAASQVDANLEDGATAAEQLPSAEVAPAPAAAPLGTPFWAAPELEHGLPHDCSADIWSFAITFVELITGFNPFYGTSKEELENICSPEAGFIPDGLSMPAFQWLSDALKVDPSERPTAQQLLDHPFFQHTAELQAHQTMAATRPSAQPFTSQSNSFEIHWNGWNEGHATAGAGHRPVRHFSAAAEQSATNSSSGDFAPRPFTEAMSAPIPTLHMNPSMAAAWAAADGWSGSFGHALGYTGFRDHMLHVALDLDSDLDDTAAPPGLTAEGFVHSNNQSAKESDA